MPKGQPLPAFEVATIMARFKKLRREGVGIMDACEKIGGEQSRAASTIWAVVRRLTPTSDIATDYFMANAYRMAHKVVKQGRTDELIDVLSRPNVGVLAPAKVESSGGGGGFFLSVTADSCAGVKIGVATQAPLPESTETKEKENLFAEDAQPQTFTVRSQASLDAIRAAEEKYGPHPSQPGQRWGRGRLRAGQKDERLQITDGQPEE